MYGRSFPTVRLLEVPSQHMHHGFIEGCPNPTHGSHGPAPCTLSDSLFKVQYLRLQCRLMVVATGT
jgi:hypothetical protein